MFKNLFTFDGRIRRLEYGISFIISTFSMTLISGFMYKQEPLIIWITSIPVYWFLVSQGAKREHDLGNSGWWQLVPFRPLWLLIMEGQPDTNEYGVNPKTKGTVNTVAPTTNISKPISNSLKPEDFESQISDIEKKEKLLFKSYTSNLISETEFIEKNNILKLEKLNTFGKKQESDLTETAYKNIQDKVVILDELKSQGLLTEIEYQTKTNDLLNTELTSLKSSIRLSEVGIKFKRRAYSTDKGELVIDQEYHQPNKGEVAFLNDKMAPTGRYKIGVFSFVEVRDGKVFDLKMG